MCFNAVRGPFHGNRGTAIPFFIIGFAILFPCVLVYGLGFCVSLTFLNDDFKDA